ncbi:MAG: tRNA preQ1(34) S-adenosylmethionine ribosyltransferase-isomerase QueA [Bacteroidales bacterium]|nr:tRNA preQ1(34) S-adenosylmethionine ribosyltransferase-isomerase QueA [Bacteroidales bacterium]
MKLSQFEYFLPEELIALKPIKDRQIDRLMVVHRDTGEVEHREFKDIIEYFGDGDVMVFNNTKIFPAVLNGKKEKTEADIEVFLLRELKAEQKLWDVLVSPARKIRIGNKLYFENDLVAEVIDNTTSRGRTIRFLYNGDSEELKQKLKKMGSVPLPPFINRDSKPEDAKHYQNPFSKHEGAVAGPTAGAHFDENLLKKLEIKGVNFGEITLHAGIGNYMRIEVEDLSKHKVDSEQIELPQITADIVNAAKDARKRICAVGTTVVKTLETPVTTLDRVDPYSGWTVQFIYPPYRVRVPNALISNFQLPQTPMLMTVAAFGGYRQMMKIYDDAVKMEYRFGPFGDAMLII